MAKGQLTLVFPFGSTYTAKMVWPEDDRRNGQCMLKGKGLLVALHILLALPLMFIFLIDLLQRQIALKGSTTDAYILNRSPSKADRTKTHFEAWHGRQPIVSQLKIFGCVAYSLISSQNRAMFDEKCKKLIFIRYSDESEKVIQFFD